MFVCGWLEHQLPGCSPRSFGLLALTKVAAYLIPICSRCPTNDCHCRGALVLLTGCTIIGRGIGTPHGCSCAVPRANTQSIPGFRSPASSHKASSMTVNREARAHCQFCAPHIVTRIQTGGKKEGLKYKSCRQQRKEVLRIYITYPYS